MADTPTPPPLWEVLNMTQEQFMRYPPSWRLAQARQHQPRPPVERRPRALEVSAEEARAFAALPVHERLTAFRKMQQEKG